jgi:hypothetical protein
MRVLDEIPLRGLRKAITCMVRPLSGRHVGCKTSWPPIVPDPRVDMMGILRHGEVVVMVIFCSFLNKTNWKSDSGIDTENSMRHKRYDGSTMKTSDGKRTES